MRHVIPLAVLAAGAVCLHAEPYALEPGPATVEQMDLDWHDGPRNRDVPVRIYYPKDGAGPFPVIVFSHGLGGTRENYTLHGRHWASYGYVVCHVQHVGSDDAVWRDVPALQRLAAMRRAAADPRNAIERPRDITFALDQLTALNAAPGPLQGRLDLKHIGMAGHSFGGYTTLAASGEAFPVGGRVYSLADPRITASIAMSAPSAKAKDTLDQSFGAIKIPILYLTGTKDDSPIGETKAGERREPYDHSNVPGQTLIIFKGADHMVFSGPPRRIGQDVNDARFDDLLHECCTAWWDAWLKGDAKAKQWLLAGGFAAEMGGDGTFETK
jgi:predicted dienelactone hydrolase